MTSVDIEQISDNIYRFELDLECATHKFFLHKDTIKLIFKEIELVFGDEFTWLIVVIQNVCIQRDIIIHIVYIVGYSDRLVISGNHDMEMFNM